MAAPNGTIRGFSGVWVRAGFDVDGNGQITGQTTPNDFFIDFVKDTSPEYAANAGAASPTYVEAKIASGKTVRWPAVTTVIDGTSSTQAEVDSGSGTPDKLSFTIFDTSPELVLKLANLRGEPVLVCMPHGYNQNGTVAYYYLLGQISSSVKFTATAETVSELPVEITGKAYTATTTATTGGNAKLTWSPAAGTPVGGSSTTPTTLITGDLTALKAGTIVQK